MNVNDLWVDYRVAANEARKARAIWAANIYDPILHDRYTALDRLAEEALLAYHAASD